MAKKQMVEQIEGCLNNRFDNLFKYLNSGFNDVKDKTRMERTISGLKEIIDEQNKIINALVTKEFQECETLDTIFIKPYRGDVYLIQNGKRIDTEHATNLTIWCNKDGVSIETETA